MRLQQHLNKFDPLIPHYVELGQKKGIRLQRQGGEYTFQFDPVGLTEWTDRFLSMIIAQKSQAALCETFCLANLFAGGLKTFEIDAGTLESFEHYDLNLSPADYHQPFPTFLIDFPEKFAMTHISKDEKGVDQIPLFGVLDFNKTFNSLHTTICLSNEMSLTYHLDLNPDNEQETIEDIIKKHRGRTLTGFRQSADDWRIGELILRAGINVSLMTTYYGVRDIGPANSSHFIRTKDRLTRAVKRGEKDLIELNQRALWKIPYCYGFTQTAPLFTKASTPKQPGQSPDGSSGHLKPHWRRGHWRRQRYGPASSLSKVIAVPAVFVNSDFALGGAAATSTTYKD